MKGVHDTGRIDLRVEFIIVTERGKVGVREEDEGGRRGMDVRWFNFHIKT